MKYCKLPLARIGVTLCYSTQKKFVGHLILKVKCYILLQYSEKLVGQHRIRKDKYALLWFTEKLVGHHIHEGEFFLISHNSDFIPHLKMGGMVPFKEKLLQ